MSQNVTVSIPHRLGKEEALRRIKGGVANASTQFGALLKVEEETWTGDHLAFRVTALGQSAAGSIDVCEDHVQLEVTLPWLLAKVAEKAKVLIEQKGKQVLLEKK